MVDVGGKRVTRRVALARGRVRMARATLEALTTERGPKADILATAHLAGVMAAKRTADLIPFAHPLPLDAVSITFETEPRIPAVRIEARVACSGRTGVEMEALTAVSVAALTIYDMLKAKDRAMVVEHVQLESKSGGKSGDWAR
jgi:cyclic pyranopterin phosphate synthase